MNSTSSAIRAGDSTPAHAIRRASSHLGEAEGRLQAQLLNASNIGGVSPGINQVRDVCGELGTSHFRATLLTRQGAGQGCRIRHTVAFRWEFRHG